MVSPVFEILFFAKKGGQTPQAISFGAFNSNDSMSLLGEEPGGVGSCQSGYIDDARHLFGFLLLVGKFLLWKHGDGMAATHDDFLMRVQNLFFLRDIDSQSRAPLARDD